MPQMSPMFWSVFILLLIMTLFLMMNILPKMKTGKQSMNKIFMKNKKFMW